MPGHKRNIESTPMKGAFRCDITEIDGFDNLHDESGIILEAEKRANSIYGSEETYFLINGSTCGVLSAVSAVMNEGETILAARGCHKSFYNAAYIKNLNIKFLPYKLNCKYGIPEVYNAQEIAVCITDDVKAVFITSPTYEGKCSDLRGIAKICHEHGIPLIVDGAHGAHFGFKCKNELANNGDAFYKQLPESAIEQGADIVIHSLHKTLPSMTQTALLHIQGKLVDRDRVKRFLRIYQTSSPSYILMASIDLCIKYIMENESEFVVRLIKIRNKLQFALKDCVNIEIPGKNIINDPAKVVIYVKNGAITGQRLYDILRERYNLQMEMAGEKFALAIITGWDTDDGIERLINAIKEIDATISESYSGKHKTGNQDNKSDIQNEFTTDENLSNRKNVIISDLPDKKMNIKEAWDSEKEVVDLESAQGHISGEFVNLYPPGIPILVPGEVISGSILEEIKQYLINNMNVQGLLDRKGFLCVKQK
ncbi:aminotransferase class I/II-fold pyridoxal phosphate-dependent enzyme [Butyrivibrio sp. YAB3001]|uniref:aminotransferase class I/II-fold pyridoxal phosphate-dependent enzyme n=1 Tax=Butyrivibrio sp. YAB3001 TaxID=1520812 RepID=UPI001FA9274F|nr:PLP-dependent transferase [Butyrivibrio sp. YAB3001]